MSEDFFIGDFPVDPATIIDKKLPANQDLVFTVEKSERKTYEGKDDKPGGAYNWLQLRSVDHPSEVVFHTYFTNAEALSEKSSARSWKVFLDRLNLPYTTTAADNGIAGIRIVAQARYDSKREEYKLSRVVGRTE